MNAMIDFPTLWICMTVGLGVGAAYFVVLWQTVCHLPAMKHPALIMTGSVFVRIGGMLIVFFGISRGDWQRFAACLLGFLMARFIALRLVKRFPAPAPPVATVFHDDGNRKDGHLD